MMARKEMGENLKMSKWSCIISCSYTQTLGRALHVQTCFHWTRPATDKFLNNHFKQFIILQWPMTHYDSIIELAQGINPYSTPAIMTDGNLSSMIWTKFKTVIYFIYWCCDVLRWHWWWWFYRLFLCNNSSIWDYQRKFNKKWNIISTVT